MTNKLGRTIADIAWDVGMEIGMVLGVQGGLLRAGREDLRAMLEDRFGPLPEEIIERIASCEDVQRLRNTITQFWRLKSLADFSL